MVEWFKRLLWGDGRDHRLFKIEMPDKFPAYVSPRPVSPFYSVYNEAMARQMQMAQLGGYQGGMGALAGSNIGQSLGLLGSMGGSLGAAMGSRRW